MSTYDSFMTGVQDYTTEENYNAIHFTIKSHVNTTDTLKVH